MRLLLGLVNSQMSLAGFDWNTGELFWSAPSTSLRACGICYWNGELVVSSDNTLTHISRDKRVGIQLPGPHPALAHSVHPIDEDRIGIIDTGNSALRVYDKQGRLRASHSPLNAWGPLPADVVHLNDFVVTPYGIVGSCFDYRPWRAAVRSSNCQGRYGVLVNLSGEPPWGPGAILACGLNHPHSLAYHNDRVYLCSSSTGSFHAWRFDANHRLVPDGDWKITERHFLRGALYENGDWYLGGSTLRHVEDRDRNGMAIYRWSENSKKLESRSIPEVGEIYDILPWRTELAEMLPLRASLQRQVGS